MTNQASEYADALMDRIQDMASAIRSGEPTDSMKEEHGADIDLYEVLHDFPLDISNELGEAFSVLVTVGGPTAAIELDVFRGGYALRVAWGSDYTERRGSTVNVVGEYYREMFN